MILLIPTPERGSCSSCVCHSWDRGKGIPSTVPLDADAGAGKWPWPLPSHSHISCWRNPRAATVPCGYLGNTHSTGQERNSLSEAHCQRSTFPTLPRDRLGHASGWDVGLTRSTYLSRAMAAHPHSLWTQRATPPSLLSRLLFLKSLYSSFHSNSPVSGAIPWHLGDNNKTTIQSYQCTLLVYDESTVAITYIFDTFEALKSWIVFISIPLLRFRNKPKDVHLLESPFASS